MLMPRYFDSMAGRLFLVLLLGVIGSAGLAVVVDAHYRDRGRYEELANRLQDFISFANEAPEPLRQNLIRSGAPGLYPANEREATTGPDATLSRLLARHLGPGVTAEHVLPQTCFAPSVVRLSNDKIRCWLVSARLANGDPLRLTLLSPRASDFSWADLDPIKLLLLVLGMGLFTFFAARMGAAPLRNLSEAALALGEDQQSGPLPERGPREVRSAISAFNTMRAQLREHAEERTRILASITHDLQTPLTRLRLRLERVSNAGLRSRLIDDLSGMQMLIREGLDFSRGAQIDEPFAQVALDNLLESLVEEAEERGEAARFVQRSGCAVEARPRTLQRCLSNLLDNAIKYGREADVSAIMRDGTLVVQIRDRGPGIPQDQIEAVFEPFVRLQAGQDAPDGAGLGLTIARTMARKNNAELSLLNLPEGGLLATVTFRGNVKRIEAASQPLEAQQAPALNHTQGDQQNVTGADNTYP